MVSWAHDQYPELRGRSTIHGANISALMSIDGTLIVSGDLSGELNVWNLELGTNFTIPGSLHHNVICNLLPFGVRGFFSLSDDGKLVRHRLRPPTSHVQARQIVANSSEVFLFPVVEAFPRCMIRRQGEDESFLVGDSQGSVTAVSLSEGIVTVNQFTSIGLFRLWDMLQVRNESGDSLIFLASSCADLHVVTSTSPIQTRRLQGHSDSIYCLAHLTRSHKVASGSADGRILVWNLADLAEDPKILVGQRGWRSAAVRCLLAVPNSDMLVSGSDDGYLRLWSVREEQCLLEVEMTDEDQPSCLCWLRDATIAVGFRTSRVLAIWDIGLRELSPVTLPRPSILPPVEIDRADITTRGTRLGAGGYGEVFEETHMGQRVAVKIVNGQHLSPQVQQMLSQEIAIMSRLRHDNIVQLYGVVHYTETSSLGIVMELCDQDLSSFLYTDSSSDIPWPARIKIALDITRGLQYVHQCGFIHADLKSQNVLLTQDRASAVITAKISDFGLARFRQSVHTLTNVAEGEVALRQGTIPWMAPELVQLEPQPLSRRTDVWALGMVFFELAARRIPFHNHTAREVVVAILRTGQGQQTIPPDCPRAFARIMERIWVRRDLRPLTSEILVMLSGLQA